MTNNNGDEKACSSPRVKQQENEPSRSKIKGDHKDVNPKKPNRKIQAKVQTQESASNKSNAKISQNGNGEPKQAVETEENIALK